jgi:hypothetical protein
MKWLKIGPVAGVFGRLLGSAAISAAGDQGGLARAADGLAQRFRA